MYAYCRNNPVCRFDIDGTLDLRVDFDADMDPEQMDPNVDSIGHTSSGNAMQGSSTGQTVGTSSSYTGSYLQVKANIKVGYQTIGNWVKAGNTHIHHIVEQCQGTKSGFSQTQIQAMANKVELPDYVHTKISAFYSSKQPFSEGLRVRNWLAGLSFEKQMAFGWSIIEKIWKDIFGNGE